MADSRNGTYVYMKDSMTSEAEVTLPILSLMPRVHLNRRTCVIVTMASLRSVKNLDEGFGLPPIGHRIEDKISFFKKEIFHWSQMFLSTTHFSAAFHSKPPDRFVSGCCLHGMYFLHISSSTPPVKSSGLTIQQRVCLSRSTMSPVLLNLI